MHADVQVGNQVHARLGDGRGRGRKVQRPGGGDAAGGDGGAGGRRRHRGLPGRPQDQRRRRLSRLHRRRRLQRAQELAQGQAGTRGTVQGPPPQGQEEDQGQDVPGLRVRHQHVHPPLIQGVLQLLHQEDGAARLHPEGQERDIREQVQQEPPPDTQPVQDPVEQIPGQPRRRRVLHGPRRGQPRLQQGGRRQGVPDSRVPQGRELPGPRPQPGLRQGRRGRGRIPQRAGQGPRETAQGRAEPLPGVQRPSRPDEGSDAGGPEDDQQGEGAGQAQGHSLTAREPRRCMGCRRPSSLLDRVVQFWCARARVNVALAHITTYERAP